MCIINDIFSIRGLYFTDRETDFVSISFICSGPEIFALLFIILYFEILNYCKHFFDFYFYEVHCKYFLKGSFMRRQLLMTLNNWFMKLYFFLSESYIHPLTIIEYIYIHTHIHIYLYLMWIYTLYNICFFEPLFSIVWKT